LLVDDSALAAEVFAYHCIFCIMPSKTNSVSQTIAIVGTGNVARVMTLALNAAGYRVSEIVVTRDAKPSHTRGSKLARQVGAKPVTLDSAKLDARIVWLCVSDAAIATVAAELAHNPVDWKGKIVLHASGALTSAELAVLKKSGASIAALHPMNTFLATSKPDLDGTPFGVEGDRVAVRAATSIAKRLSHGAPIFRIAAKDKPLYHAIGSFTSPLTIATLNVAERVAKAAGIGQPRELMRVILLRTVNNFLNEGSAAAFSGPIRRGDVATIKKHLAALRRVPDTESVYRALALNAVEHLPSKNQAELRKLLRKKKS
jgi:predicted short-subunit dehydrogenase-like oxidoreductase (DUF2520 family)